MEMHKISSWVAVIIFLCVITGCTEEETMYFDEGSAYVDFTVVNPAVGGDNTAYSIPLPYSNWDWDDRRRINFEFVNSYGNIEEKVINIWSRELKIWIGGLNTVIINYSPACPEEKEVTFTMPDGQEIIVSGETSFEWELNYDTIRKTGPYYSYSLLDNNFIYARSEYLKDGVVVHGYGLIRLVTYDSCYFVYDKETRTWYNDNWVQHPDRWKR